MTIINKAFINECFKFLSKAAEAAVRDGMVEVLGIIPNGPQYRITTEKTEHTNVGRYRIDLKCNENVYHTVFAGEYWLSGTIPKLTLLDQAEFEIFVGYGIYNIIHYETGFDEILDDMLTGRSGIEEVNHFSGITIKFQTKVGSQCFMVFCGDDIYYSLEEKPSLRKDGTGFTSMTDAKDLKIKALSVIKDYIETFELLGFEHTFN